MEILPEALQHLPDTVVGLVGLLVLSLVLSAVALFKQDRAATRLLVFFSLFIGSVALVFWIWEGPNGGRQDAGPADPASPATLPATETARVGPLDPCAGVDISFSPGSAIAAAWWCGSPGATRTTLQQAALNPTPSCTAYAQSSFAELHQHELFKLARVLAKQGKDQEAFQLIDACQCHNPQEQALLREGHQRVICYLKNG